MQTAAATVIGCERSCPECLGLGRLYGFDGVRHFWETCLTCKGRGKV